MTRLISTDISCQVSSSVSRVYAGNCGDNKWRREEFGFTQHYANHDNMCHECCAKMSGPLSYANALPNAPWTEAPRELADVFDGIMGQEKDFPLTRLEGFHVQNNFQDLVHDDLLGLRPHACGATPKNLCDEGTWGAFGSIGNWSDRLDSQLKVAFEQFCLVSKGRRFEHSQAVFSHLNLSMKRKTSESIVKAKATNCQVVSSWLLDMCESSIDTEFKRMQALMMRGFNDSYLIAERTTFPNFVLDDSQAESLETARKQMLLGYHWLAKYNVSRGWSQYHLIPKFHYLDHALRRAVRTKVSPSIFWCFAQESKMGETARLVHKLHGASSMRRGIGRWLVSFFFQLEESDECSAA